MALLVDKKVLQRLRIVQSESADAPAERSRAESFLKLVLRQAHQRAWSMASWSRDPSPVLGRDIGLGPQRPGQKVSAADTSRLPLHGCRCRLQQLKQEPMQRQLSLLRV